ncbi:unnamed protein product [Adineta steineri]|uniref:Uncharacterized protein n=1 Tax=Adineta steineri TaxID=433720 RepID=A0A813NGJ3_9BILA|nr:unnamed protein product [Adineta steineri]
MDDYPKHWMGKIRKDCCLRYSSLIFLIIINILSITALIIGFLFRGQCSIEQNISIYLVVAGFIFTIYYTFLLVLMLMMMLTDKEDVDSLPKRKRCALAITRLDLGYVPESTILEPLTQLAYTAIDEKQYLVTIAHKTIGLIAVRLLTNNQ